MERTKSMDDLFDVGWQALQSHDPAAFMEWRRRVAEVLGPDHLYAQLFQSPENKKSHLTSANNREASTCRRSGQNKCVA